MIKNSVPLKEVLTHRSEDVRHGLIGGTAMLARNDASSARKRNTGGCQFAKNACAASVFIVRTFGDRSAADVIGLIEAGRKRVAWTLSLGFWQEKNFSCSAASRVFLLAKTGPSRESTAAIRDAIFGPSDAAPLMVNDTPLMVNDRCTRAGA
jgi:hypothetical protein